jgi:hypothetical protein
VGTIAANVSRILAELPAGVELVAVVKGHRPVEIQEAVEAGVTILGENYVQEAERVCHSIAGRVKWHFIGHLQKNKVKKAVAIFDMIQTVDSVPIAREIDETCAQAGKTMPVLIEVNSGREDQKWGVLPDEAASLVGEISPLHNIRVIGLMTMGPRSGDPEQSRPYFAATRKIFEGIKQLNLPNVEMRRLSMGMSNSYRVAISEGANMVRLGREIFGESS